MTPRRPDRASRHWYLYPLGLVALAIVIVAIIEVGPPTSSARTSREMVQAENGVVQSTVSGSGNVEPATDDTVDFATSGTLQDVYVQVGQHVTQGQLLATLDPSSAELTLAQAQANLTAAEDQLTAARDAASSSTASATSVAVENAPQFVSDGLTSAAATTTTAATTPTARPRRTKPARTVTVTVTTPARAPSTSSRGSSSAGTSSSAGGSSGSTDPAASIASAEASVDSAKASVASAEAAVAATKLYAPVSGTIATLESASPGQTISSGSASASSTGSSTASASSAATGGFGGSQSAGSLGGSSSSSSSSGTSSSGFATIIDASALTMTVAFSESDIASVKVGQPATISIDALSGVELAAKVTSISPIGTDSNGVVSYDATLTADQSNPQVRAGMSATATVITAQASGVTLPNGAISGSGSSGTVELMRDGRTVTQPVVVGLRGSSRSQILSGLSAGQEVVEEITLPALGTTSTTSSSSGTLGGGGGFGGGGFFRAGGGGFGGGGAGAFFRGGGFGGGG